MYVTRIYVKYSL